MPLLSNSKTKIEEGNGLGAGVATTPLNKPRAALNYSADGLASGLVSLLHYTVAPLNTCF